MDFSMSISVAPYLSIRKSCTNSTAEYINKHSSSDWFTHNLGTVRCLYLYPPFSQAEEVARGVKEFVIVDPMVDCCFQYCWQNGSQQSVGFCLGWPGTAYYIKSSLCEEWAVWCFELLQSRFNAKSRCPNHMLPNLLINTASVSSPQLPPLNFYSRPRLLNMSATPTHSLHGPVLLLRASGNLHNRTVRIVPRNCSSIVANRGKKIFLSSSTLERGCSRIGYGSCSNSLPNRLL